MKIFLQQIPPPGRPDIEPIEVPDPLPDLTWIYLWIGIALLILVAVGALVIALVTILSRKKRRVLTAESVALQKLSELELQADDRNPNDFSQSVSDVLKDLVESRFGDRLRYETSQEFLQRHSSEQSKITPDVRAGLAEFLGISEEIKFGLPPDAEKRKRPLLEKARHIVETQRQIMRAEQEAAARRKK